MAQAKSASNTAKSDKCPTRQRKASPSNSPDTLITSAERKKRKGSIDKASRPSKRPVHVEVEPEAHTPRLTAEVSAAEQEQGVDSQATPSRRVGDESTGQDAGRTAAQSPRGGQAPKPKAGVFNSIISPVLTLFQGKQEGQDPSEPTVLLQDGRKAHVGIHHCDGGPEPAHHSRALMQVEGMPLNEAEPCPGNSTPVPEGGSAARVEGGTSSTDGESDTCVDEGALCASASSSRDEELEEAGAAKYVEEEEYDGECIDFDPYAFIKNLPPLKQVVPRWRRSLLPRQTRQCKRKTLVLDLDETLVHSTLDGCDEPDFSFPVSFNGREHRVHVRRRPHLQPFLQRCAELFEVVVFTASQKVYAEQLLNILDPTRTLIRHRVFRDSCVFVEGNYLKDLSILGRDLAHTVIVDNSPQAFGYQLPNGIPIESWYDDETDSELLNLLPFLESLVDVDDVRPALLAAYKLHQLVESAPTYPSYH
ncbi:probable CTD small phosphatase-like protein 2 at C-terminar half [Coccomyxa sp. Obi]|nr:probable CTD small phosphatase-like protein 2 at C-terminar half [Coccomyxa sp. Obi]